MANRQRLFEQANQGAYSIPGTHAESQNKDFGAVSQKDLTRVYFCQWRRLKATTVTLNPVKMTLVHAQALLSIEEI